MVGSGLTGACLLGDELRTPASSPEASQIGGLEGGTTAPAGKSSSGEAGSFIETGGHGEHAQGLIGDSGRSPQAEAECRGTCQLADGDGRSRTLEDDFGVARLSEAIDLAASAIRAATRQQETHELDHDVRSSVAARGAQGVQGVEMTTFDHRDPGVEQGIRRKLLGTPERFIGAADVDQHERELPEEFQIRGMLAATVTQERERLAGVTETAFDAGGGQNGRAMGRPSAQGAADHRAGGFKKPLGQKTLSAEQGEAGVVRFDVQTAGDHGIS